MPARTPAACSALLAPFRPAAAWCKKEQEPEHPCSPSLRAPCGSAIFPASGNADSRSDGVPSKFCDLHCARILMDTVISSISISQLLQHSNSKWVTRERPKIDRIACPWLIRRFIDPRAEFLYVPSAQVRAVAEAEQAIPYDVPDVQFSHRGELCSFDAFLADFAIDDPVLADLALIVRGADTGRLELTPQSPCLLAVSLGLSVNYPDDHGMLEHGMVVYDALYAWIRSTRAEVRNADLVKKPS